MSAWVRDGEGAVFAAAGGEAVFVEGVVVDGAEQCEVGEVGGAAVGPVGEVVGLEAVGAFAAGEGADAAVAEFERFALLGGDEALVAAVVEVVEGDESSRR